jgi:hypothetical protein
MQYELKDVDIEVDGDFVYIKYHQQALINIEDAKVIAETIRKYVPETGAYGMINDITQLKDISREARDYFAQTPRKNSFNAIIINHYLHSVLTKIYFTFSKPINETKVFDNYEDAKNGFTQN